MLVDILLAHDLVPVLQPVFQGFGWKGLDVAGTVVPPEDYARYCRYLVARYGARPAVYLVGADGSGEEPQVAAGGEEVHAWDAYGQPTGIHYRPHATNHAHQDADWLDFQSCQTGHDGEHLPERVADMWRNTPAKGVLNLEPTYENTRERGRAAGWWQGHEAWSNLCAGGTMGVGYGAASLWQWRLHADEPGHTDVLPGPGRRLARGAGLRGVDLRRRWSAASCGICPFGRHGARLDQLARRAEASACRASSCCSTARRPDREADGPATCPATSPSSTRARARSSSRRCWTRWASCSRGPARRAPRLRLHPPADRQDLTCRAPPSPGRRR